MRIQAISNNYQNRQNTNFGAKLNNITIKDNVADNILKFIEEMKAISKNNYPSNYKVGNVTFNHSPYTAGWLVKTEDRFFGVDFDQDNKLYSLFMINNEKDENGKEIIKSFDYYLGTPTAVNPVPEICYSEFESDNFKDGMHRHRYINGSSVPDNIADRINKVVDSTLRYMGIK